MPTTTKNNSTTPATGDSKAKIVSTKVGTVESDKRSKSRTVVVRY